MSEASPSSPAPSQTPSEWRNPQVMLTMIATLSTVLVAIIGIVPAILEAGKTKATPTPMVIVLATSVPLEPTRIILTPTAAPPTLLPVFEPTHTPELVLSPTPVPTLTPLFEPTVVPTIPPTNMPVVNVEPTATPNITLFYDHDSFTILNSSGSRASLEGIVFRSSAATWDIAPFGGLMKALPKNMCIRMRDAMVGNRQPPSACGKTLYGFLEIGPKVIFWRDVEQFEVVRNSTVIATCDGAAGTCPIYVEQ